jgi:hypothetical protein
MKCADVKYIRFEFVFATCPDHSIIDRYRRALQSNWSAHEGDHGITLD